MLVAAGSSEIQPSGTRGTSDAQPPPNARRRSDDEGRGHPQSHRSLELGSCSRSGGGRLVAVAHRWFLSSQRVGFRSILPRRASAAISVHRGTRAGTTTALIAEKTPCGWLWLCAPRDRRIAW